MDGCNGGWLVALATAWPPANCRLQVCGGFHEVLGATVGCGVVVVDLPIGLPEGAGGRECDVLARQRLGRAACRVFNPLPRSLLQCADYAACNRRHRVRFQKGLSRQAFALRARLLEVDRHMTPALQERVFEFHPELVWQRLNGGEPLPSKHTPEGLRRRKALLRGAIPNLDALLAQRPVGCRPDDVLDALVGLELAHRLAQKPGRAQRLPESPRCDARGLRMEIWF
ncbi:MAG: DUF429 domain-containing protein [Verrucomicrobiales bacterium]|nr:DUF429 domain-containing protein [Verrucomicrobiales bacterium]